jgi:(R,R)-butanediol dehydrogenase / meso-butanediol dehydrogenase / diacetyl reductase
MRAACLHGPRDIRVDEVPAPAPGRHEVALRPLFTGLCGSDLHVWENGPINDGERMVLGHEFSAEVIEVGAAVADPRLRPGALVAVEPMWTCGTCGPCRRGAYNLCRKMVWHGLSARSGGLAECTVVAPRMVHVLPSAIDAVQGALIEPIAVAHHAVGRLDLDSDPESAAVVVLGAGPVGVAAVLDLQARGVRTVIVSEPSATRRAAAATAMAAAGADAAYVVDPSATDLAEAVRDATGGEGADAAIDAAGVELAFRGAIAAVRPGGVVVTVAIYLQPVSYHPLMTLLSEIDLRSSCAYRDDFPAVIDLMTRGAFPLEGWVEQVRLADVSGAFARLAAGDGGKILVDLRS